jgi:hypothetical protein
MTDTKLGLAVRQDTPEPPRSGANPCGSTLIVTGTNHGTTVLESGPATVQGWGQISRSLSERLGPGWTVDRIEFVPELMIGAPKRPTRLQRVLEAIRWAPAVRHEPIDRW